MFWIGLAVFFCFVFKCYTFNGTRVRGEKFSCLASLFENAFSVTKCQITTFLHLKVAQCPVVVLVDFDCRLAACFSNWQRR